MNHPVTMTPVQRLAWLWEEPVGERHYTTHYVYSWITSWGQFLYFPHYWRIGWCLARISWSQISAWRRNFSCSYYRIFPSITPHNRKTLRLRFSTQRHIERETAWFAVVVGVNVQIIALGRPARRWNTPALCNIKHRVINCDSWKVWSELGGHVRWRQRERERNDWKQPSALAMNSQQCGQCLFFYEYRSIYLNKEVWLPTDGTLMDDWDWNQSKPPNNCIPWMSQK